MKPIEKAAAVATNGINLKASAVDGPQWWTYWVSADGTTANGVSPNAAAEAWLVIRRGYVDDRRHGERRKNRR